MKTSCSKLLFTAFTAFAAAFPVPGRADALENIGLGLDFAGFDVIGNRNPLSGGADLLITNSFDGSVFDFGATELTLRGPVSLEVSTGGRLLSQFDISLTTALDSRSQVVPLSYSFTSDVGPQATSVSGSTFVDADFSINGFGFYDLTLTYSSRQTVVRDGHVVTDENNFDSDVGPITVSGNIFTDALVLLTDPLFESSGRENPFAALSAAAKLIDLNPSGGLDLLDAVAAADVSPDSFYFAQNWKNKSAALGAGRNQGTAMVAPEPPVVLLLLAGLPLLLRRALRAYPG